MRSPSRSTAQTLRRRSPPTPISDVADAMSHCRSHELREIVAKERRDDRAWRTRQATSIWCIAKIIAVDAHARPSTSHDRRHFADRRRPARQALRDERAEQAFLAQRGDGLVRKARLAIDRVRCRAGNRSR